MKKRVIVGFFMLFICIYTSGVFSEGGGTVYFHEVQNKFVDIPDPPHTTSNIVTEHLVRASNTKNYWERFQQNIRSDYLNTNSQDALKKQLTAQQLTYEESLRRVIKDNEKVWGDIKLDSDKLRTDEVLKNILKADNKNLGDVDLSKSKLQDSRFTKLDSKDVFQYGKEKAKIFTADPNIKKLKFDDSVLMNEDESSKLTFNSGQFYGAESLTEFPEKDSSGRIDKPFEDISCSAKNKEVTFLKDNEKFTISSFEGGEFWIKDNKNNLFIYGKSVDGKLGDMSFLNIPEDGIKKGTSQDTLSTLYKGSEGVARVYFPLSPPISRTNFIFDPEVSSPEYNPLFSTDLNGFLPLVSAEESLITSDNQYVNIIGYKLLFSGQKIGVEILRPFDSIFGSGEFLNILNGETYIEFRGSNTYYSREIKENKFFVNLLQNGRGSSNLFKILSGGTKGNYLVDSEKRVTVGEKTVPIPSSLEGFSGIMIPKTREAMWKKAVERV